MGFGNLQEKLEKGMYEHKHANFFCFKHFYVRTFGNRFLGSKEFLLFQQNNNFGLGIRARKKSFEHILKLALEKNLKAYTEVCTM